MYPAQLLMFLQWTRSKFILVTANVDLTLILETFVAARINIYAFDITRTESVKSDPSSEL